MLDNLSVGDSPSCPGTDEVKAAYVNRLTSESSNALYVGYTEDTGNSVYVCFNPQSGSFKKEADDRCVSSPSDFPSEACGSCPKTSKGKSDNCVCLP